MLSQMSDVLDVMLLSHRSHIPILPSSTFSHSSYTSQSGTAHPQCALLSHTSYCALRVDQCISDSSGNSNGMSLAGVGSHHLRHLPHRRGSGICASIFRLLYGRPPYCLLPASTLYTACPLPQPYILPPASTLLPAALHTV